MGETGVIQLLGCAPTPLASYLKALGVIRLISTPANSVTGQAADPNARGWWENECFYLRTALSRDALMRFFLQEYAPSPIMAPWNGRAGFLEGDDRANSKRTGARLIREFTESKAVRFSNLRRAIGTLDGNSEIARYNFLRSELKKLDQRIKASTGEERRALQNKEKETQRDAKRCKSVLLPFLRSTTEQDHLPFIDACYVLASNELTMPLLGSGGNDGSGDFGIFFAREISALIDLDEGTVTENGKSSLRGSIFGGGRALNRGKFGQFSPGQGGRNSTTGYVGDGDAVNSWDVVLAMEGTLVFAGVASRRHKASNAEASFPFTVRAVGSGSGSVGATDEANNTRAEFWAPIWPRPARYCEIERLLGEGRAVLNERTARDGVDFARSVTSLGVSRGLTAFERYAFQKRNGNNHIASPLGRFSSTPSPSAELVADLDVGGWLNRVRRIGRKQEEPAAARRAIKRLEDTLFGILTPTPSPEQVQMALVALGSCASWLVLSPNGRTEVGSPPPRLSSRWLRLADDGSPEFRVATALAGLGLPAPPMRRKSSANKVHGSASFDSHDWERTALPMAVHFAPVEEAKFFHGTNLSRRRAWAAREAPRMAVWSAGSLVPNLLAVLERRMIEASMRGLSDKPLGGAVWARAEDLIAFIYGPFNDARCADLLRGLVWAAPARLSSGRARSRPSWELPFAYAVLKPICSTDVGLRRVRAIDGATRLPVPPGMLARLRASGSSTDGRAIDEVVRVALARARGSGLTSPFDSSTLRRAAASRIGTGVRADRLAASLLIPVGDRLLKSLINRAYTPIDPDEGTSTEANSHAT